MILHYSDAIIRECKTPKNIFPFTYKDTIFVSRPHLSILNVVLMASAYKHLKIFFLESDPWWEEDR